MSDKERVDLAYRRNSYKIHLFRLDKLARTANSMKAYMYQVMKSPTVSFYEIDQIDLDLRTCIKEEFSKSKVEGQEYRSQCFNDVNATFIRAMNTLDKNNAEGVLEAFSVHGAYDIIVKVKADTFSNLKDIIARIKRNLPKMQNMETILIVEPSTPS